MHNRNIALLFALFILAPACLFASSASFQRTLSVSGNPTVHVCTNSGWIHITGTDGNQVKVTGKVEANKGLFGGASDADIQKIASQPPITQSGDHVEIGNHDTCSGHLFRNISIDYDIAVPKGSQMTVSSGSGDIRSLGLTGSLQADTGSGDIQADGMTGDSKFETGSGSIDVSHAQGSIKAEADSGRINIHASQLNDANLETGSGSITAENVHGSVKARAGSGNLAIAGTPTADWKLETGSGSIRFRPDPTAKFTLDAETASGNIHSTLTVAVSGTVEHGRLRGPVNGGGTTVRLETGSGAINID